MKIEPFTVDGTGVGNTDYAAPRPVGQVPVGPVYTLTDLAELAVRLNSSDIFDRRGNVIMMDSFEGGIEKWFTESYGAGGYTEWTTIRARTGSFSLRLVAGSDWLRSSIARRWIAYPIMSRFGFEVSFYLLQEGTVEDMSLLASLYDGTHMIDMGVGYNLVDKRLYYYDSDLNEVDLATGLNLYSPNMTIFHTMKVVIDGERREYVRLMLNDMYFDLSGVALHSMALPTESRLQIKLGVHSRAACNGEMYVDDVIVTQNEPINV